MGRFSKAAEALRNATDSVAVSELVERSKKAYEEFNSLDPLRYEPLPTPTSIRLLKLEPCKAMKKSGNATAPSDADGKDDEDDVRFIMQTAELDRHPIFTALSYTWRQQYSQTGSWLRHWSRLGGKYFNDEPDKHLYEVPESDAPLTETRKVNCNGYLLKVSDNLFDALKQLRRKKPGEWLWIDAICMNQKDGAELQAQIKIMGRIYQSCRSTIVWLGSISKVAKLGLPYLDEIVKSDNPLPPFPLYDGEENVVGNTLAQDCSLVAAASTAFHLTQRSWFKRVWVVQELCFARDVTYLHGKYEISLDMLLKSTRWCIDTESGRASASELIIRDLLAPYYVAHMHFLPITLQAREDFAKGNKWTLLQWFQICSGRLASVAKDYVFAGLSLVREDLLVIDQSLQPIVKRPILPPRPSGGSSTLPLIDNKTPETNHEKSLTPKGLWHKLVPDYSTSDAEVFVVATACLLSHASVEDLFRVSARLRDIYQFRNHQTLRPRDLDAWSGLPSWVPALGSWTSHLTTDLTLESPVKPPALQTSSQNYSSDKGPGLYKPRISSDGRTLSVHAMSVDTVASCEAQKDEPLENKEWRRMLGFLATGTGIYRDDHGAISGETADSSSEVADGETASYCLLEALAVTLVAGYVNGNAVTPAQAGSWLCESLESKVMHLILELQFKVKCNQELRQKIEKKASEKKHGIDYLETAEKDEEAARWRESKEADLTHHETIKEITAELKAVKERYIHLAWPGDSIEAVLTKDEVEKIKAQWKEEGLELLRKDSDDGKSTMSTMSSISGTLERSKKGIIGYLDEQWLNAQMWSENVQLRYYRRIISDECRAYEEKYMETLAWRKIIMTEKGHVAIGPLWLEKGDSIMLLPEASMPFVFVKEEEDLVREQIRIQERLIQVGSESDEARLWASFKPQLDARSAEIQDRLEKVKAHGLERWVLIGEIYVDSLAVETHARELEFSTIEVV